VRDFLVARINNLNIRRGEIIEILKAVVLSRGIISLIDGMQLIEGLECSEESVGRGAKTTAQNTAE
jgi:hypothetical protein